MCILFPAYAQTTPQAKANLQIEVVIPDRAAMYFAEEASTLALETTDSSLMSTQRRGPRTDLTTVFNLRCATYSILPQACHHRLLDTQGRAYPPTTKTNEGKVRGGKFPQYFESPAKTLRIFTPSPSWKVLVDMIGEPSELSANNFSVFSSTNGWHCLGFHPDWELSPALETCPTFADASRSSVTVAATTEGLGGWYDITLGLKLRLDGSEPAGNYNGVLRYTLVSF